MQEWRRLEVEQMTQVVASHRQGLKVLPRKINKNRKNIAN